MTMLCVAPPELGGLCVVWVPALLRMHVEYSQQTGNEYVSVVKWLRKKLISTESLWEWDNHRIGTLNHSGVHCE